MESEHHHEHSSEHHQSPKKDNMIASSIIVGAILISASIFYNTKLIIQELGPGAGNNRLAGQAQNPGGGAGVAAPSQPVAPTGPVQVAERKDAPVLGNKNAKVVFEEFTDFQCPFCQRFFSDAYKQIKTKYVDSGKVRMVFRHFPLSFHANAQKAAEAAECANRQGKFIEYHDVLFQKGQADGAGLDINSLKAYAADLKLNVSRFNQCLDKGETAKAVKADFDAGQAAGVSGTPTMFINGVRLVGAQPFTSFEQAIETAIK